MVARRGKTASSLAEVVVAIIMIVPAMLVLGDLFLFLVGSRANEDVCGNAARAASTVAPVEAAKIAASMVKFANGQISTPILCNFDLAAPVVVKAAKAEPGRIEADAVRGTVTVSTEVQVNSFVLKVLNHGEPFHFRCTKTCPISYVEAPKEAEVLQ